MTHSASIQCAAPGHEFECVVNITGYDLRNYIPESVAKKVRAALPEGWHLDNRGSRLEAYPPDHAPGETTSQAHGEIVAVACREAGLNPTSITVY